MKTYRAITINPHTRTIALSTMQEEDQLKQFYAQMNCCLVRALTLPNGDTAWIDDEGTFVRDQAFFIAPFWHDPLAGICIITGTVWDDQGDNLDDCKSTVEELAATVQFKSRAELVAMYESGELA